MIKQSIDDDIKTAMLGGDRETVNILRTVKSVILDEEVKQRKRQEGLPDDQIVALLQKEVKKRTEASELYKNAGDSERAAKELRETVVINKYLPAMMSDDEVAEIVKEVIAQTDDVSMQKMGQIIGAVKAKTGPAADGSVIARLVKEQITN
jgi:uncharacterized protein YqeY